MTRSEVYRHPRYYDLGYRWNTEVECDFLEACLKAHGSSRPESIGGRGPAQATRPPDIGCGTGRPLMTLAKRGYQMTGVDASPEMVAYVKEEASKAGQQVAVSVDDLRHLAIKGRYDAAFCFMDTFRFLLTNKEILAHLRTVAGLLTPGGLYVTDFWVT